MQKKVKIFNDAASCHRKKMPAYARLLDIQSEMGELSKEYLKATKYGTKDFEMNDDFVEEYGDVLYALLSLANELDIDCEKSLDAVLEKLAKRMKEKNSMGSGR